MKRFAIAVVAGLAALVAILVYADLVSFDSEGADRWVPIGCVAFVMFAVGFLSTTKSDEDAVRSIDEPQPDRLQRVIPASPGSLHAARSGGSSQGTVATLDLTDPNADSATIDVREPQEVAASEDDLIDTEVMASEVDLTEFAGEDAAEDEAAEAAQDVEIDLEPVAVLDDAVLDDAVLDCAVLDDAVLEDGVIQEDVLRQDVLLEDVLSGTDADAFARSDADDAELDEEVSALVDLDLDLDLAEADAQKTEDLVAETKIVAEAEIAEEELVSAGLDASVPDVAAVETPLADAPVAEEASAGEYELVAAVATAQDGPTPVMLDADGARERELAPVVEVGAYSAADLEASVRNAEKSVVRMLIEQGRVTPSGEITDDDVAEMILVATTSQDMLTILRRQAANAALAQQNAGSDTARPAQPESPTTTEYERV